MKSPYPEFKKAMKLAKKIPGSRNLSKSVHEWAKEVKSAIGSAK